MLDNIGKKEKVMMVGAAVILVVAVVFTWTALRSEPTMPTLPPEVPAFLIANPQFAPLAKEVMGIALSCLKKDPAERPTADQLVQKCSELCYTSSPRRRGIVRDFRHGAWGFIGAPTGDVFFHKECVYGSMPKVGDQVIFSSYDGGGAPRALPVVKVNDQ